MRLREEKTLIIIEIVTLVFVGIASILLQIVDIKIENYNDDLIKTELKRSHYLQLTDYHSQEVDFWTISGLLAQLGTSLLGTELKLEEDPTIKSENMDRPLQELMNEYKTGMIDSQTYICKRGILSRNKLQDYASQLKQTNNLIENMLNSPPKFLLFNALLFKKICLLTSFLGSILAVILFVILFIGVSKRIKN